MPLNRTVKERNLQVKPVSTTPIEHFAPPKGIKWTEMSKNIDSRELTNSSKPLPPAPAMSTNKIQELIDFHKETKAEVWEILNLLSCIVPTETVLTQKERLESEYELRSSFINQLEDLL